MIRPRRRLLVASAAAAPAVTTPTRAPEDFLAPDGSYDRSLVGGGRVEVQTCDGGSNRPWFKR